jgi:hypothetical protein
MIGRFQVDPEIPDVMTPERPDETAQLIIRIEQPWYTAARQRTRGRWFCPALPSQTARRQKTLAPPPGPGRG